MTCIVGLLHDDGVIVGCDSAVTSSDSRALDRHKVRRFGSLLIGAAGHCRETELAVARVPRYVRGPLATWCSARYYPAILEAVKAERGSGPVELQLLVASATEIVGIDADGACYEWARGWGAVGMGGPIALGALHATQRSRMRPRARVEAALRAASDLCGSVAPPWIVQELSR